MKKFEPKSPDPYIIEDGDQAVAKFGHLNWIVKNINTFPINEILTPDYAPNVNFIITAAETIINFKGLMTSDLYIGLDISACTVGNILTFCFKANPLTNDITVHWDSNIYYTACGNNSDTFDMSGHERWVIAFFFDGEKFVNTQDNC